MLSRKGHALLVVDGVHGQTCLKIIQPIGSQGEDIPVLSSPLPFR